MIRIRSGAVMNALAACGLVAAFGSAAMGAEEIDPACQGRIPETSPAQTWSPVVNETFRDTQLIRQRWQTRFPWGGRTLNQELELYVDPNAFGGGALQPFGRKDGLFTIRAARVPQAMRGIFGGHPYVSGLLTTAGFFHQLYGYFEISTRLPKGKGLWPGFWLLPVNLSWPPEIDILEAVGDAPNTLEVTAHSAVNGRHVQQGFKIPVPDMSQAQHVYGLLWSAPFIGWYFDNHLVACVPTPDDLHQPMYMLVNLAVGGAMPGSPDENTHFPAEMEIAFIRAYQLPSGYRPGSAWNLMQVPRLAQATATRKSLR